MRFNGFTDEWESITINNLSRIVTKQTGFDYTNTIKKSLKNERTITSLPYIQTKNFHDRSIDYNTDYYIPLDIADKFPKIKLDEKCILLSIVGASVGNIGFFDHKEDSFLSGAICVIKVKKCTYLNDIYFYMQSPYGQAQIKTTTKGAAQATITIDDIRNYIIRRPPNELERNKIVNLLNLIDERIETQNKIIEKLESLKIELKERIYLSGKDKESFAKILHEKTEKSTMQNQYPVLSSTVKGLFLQSEYFDRSVASENNIGYKIVKKGQIIISPQNLWMGNLTINEKYENGIVSPSYKIYEIDKKYSGKYIFWLLTSKRSFFNYSLVSEQGASIVRRNLNLDAFMELCLPVIKDVNTQQKIYKLIDSIEKKIDAEKKRGALLNKQKSFLLSNLFI